MRGHDFIDIADLDMPVLSEQPDRSAFDVARAGYLGPLGDVVRVVAVLNAAADAHDRAR